MLFGKNKKVNSTRIETLVGKNTCVTGDLTFTGGLHVEGRIEGNVQAGDESSVLILSEDGLIQGDVHVPNTILNGQIEGDVYSSDHVELAPRARITGNVYYNLIEMSMGATLNGNLIHQQGGKPKLEYKEEEPGSEAPKTGDEKDTSVSSSDKKTEASKPGQTQSSGPKTAASARNS
jgi:cytoskeletal protein CcmA (bactofilin family)